MKPKTFFVKYYLELQVLSTASRFMQSSLPEDPFLYHHKVTNNDLKVFNIFQASSDESDMGTLVVL